MFSRVEWYIELDDIGNTFLHWSYYLHEIYINTHKYWMHAIEIGFLCNTRRLKDYSHSIQTISNCCYWICMYLFTLHSLCVQKRARKWKRTREREGVSYRDRRRARELSNKEVFFLLLLDYLRLSVAILSPFTYGWQKNNNNSNRFHSISLARSLLPLPSRFFSRIKSLAIRYY